MIKGTDMKDCCYPECINCTFDECIKEEKDIAAMLKRRRWNNNPDLYRQKQRDYRKRIRDNLPRCNECEECVIVKQTNKQGYYRLCIDNMQLIEQKVSNSPKWCKKRKQK